MKKIAVIGCGYWGSNLARNFYKIKALHTICDPDETIEKKNKKIYKGIDFTAKYRTVFANPDIDAVAIASPAATHYNLTKEALQSGKDVFVEKPLSLCVGEARELVNLAKSNGRILMVDHLLHYHPAIERLKEIIKRGELGQIQYIYSNRLNIGKFRKEENILWSFAPHDISIILALAGGVPKKVHAFGGAYLQKNIYDTTVTTLLFPKNMRAHIFVSWLHPFKEQKLVVIGTKNMAVFDDLSREKLTLFPHRVKWVKGLPIAAKVPHKNVPVGADEPLQKVCRHFISCIEKRTRPLTDGEEALRVLKVLNKVQAVLEGERDEKKEEGVLLPQDVSYR